jgi:DNA topoisomerase-1
MNRLLKKLEKIGGDPKITAKAVGLRYVRIPHLAMLRGRGRYLKYIDKLDEEKDVNIAGLNMAEKALLNLLQNEKLAEAS